MADELPPDLRNALQHLPREVPLLPEEEERTVRALRRSGLLPATQGRSPRLTRWLPLAARLAAAVVLFAAGAAYGSERASRRALEAQLRERDRDARETALLVQRAGSAYVQAVAALAALAPSAPRDPALAQGREAALTLLRSAAGELGASIRVPVSSAAPGVAPARPAQPLMRF